MDKRIVDMVKDDLERKARDGERHYGGPLTRITEVDGLKEAYDEMLDKVQYMRLAILQREELLAENQRLRDQLAQAKFQERI